MKLATAFTSLASISFALFAGCSGTSGIGETVGADIVSCPSNIDVVVYVANDGPQLADSLQRNPSPCAQYYLSIPAEGTEPLGPTQAPAMRARGSQFHALAEFQWDNWGARVGHDPAIPTWYAAGVAFRAAMIAEHYDVGAGDTWAINELHRPIFAASEESAADMAAARMNVREAVRGLFDGPPGGPHVAGVAFMEAGGPEYQSELENLLRDDAFWSQMEANVRWFAPEVYVVPGQVCVAGSGVTVADRSLHVNERIEHMPRLAASAGAPASATAAHNYLAHAFVPLMNGVWGNATYDTESLTYQQMDDFVSLEFYAARSWASDHAYPGGRVGFAWSSHGSTATPDGLVHVADRVASAIAGAYGAGGGHAIDACSTATDVYADCECVVSGAAFDERWDAFGTWNCEDGNCGGSSTVAAASSTPSMSGMSGSGSTPSVPSTPGSSSTGTAPTAPAPTGCGAMQPNTALTTGAFITSCDGRFDLDMQTDGNLVLYQGSTPLWATGTNGSGACVAIMQGDGNFVVYDCSGVPLWASHTSGNSGATLALQDDANLVVYAGSTPLWTSNTGMSAPPPPAPATPCGTLAVGDTIQSGHALVSCDGRFHLDMQGDANLVLYQGSTALWASHRSGDAGAHVVMQTDGNLVVYTATGDANWASNTSGHDGATLSVQDDGNAVVYGPDGSPVWASNTGGH